MSYVAGIDIGTAHMKYCLLDLDTLKSHTGIMPLWSQSKDRTRVIEGTLTFLLTNKLKEYKIARLGIVSSFEGALASEPSKSLEVRKAILNAVKDYEAYTLDEKLTLVDLSKEEWVPLSSVYSTGYVASLLLDSGLFIQMNTASTIIAPVKNHRYVSINAHKYTSGEGAWIGALYTPLSMSMNQGLIFGHYCHLSPYGAHTGDIASILFPEQFKQALEKQKSPMELSHEDSVNRFLQLLGQLQNYAGPYNLENQVKTFALMCYYEVLDKIRKMVLQVLSFIDVDPSKANFVVSGIGKDLFLKKALEFSTSIDDVEKYLDANTSINLEAFGVAAAIAKEKAGLNVLRAEHF